MILKPSIFVLGPFVYTLMKKWNSGTIAGDSRKQYPRGIAVLRIALSVSTTKLRLTSIIVKETPLLTVRGDHRK